MVATTYISGDTFLYVIGVAPEDEAATYRNVFTRILESLQVIN